ncbi:hypothetical protein SAMN04489712_103144 [Thermomonospora echinospora]|uniref:Uncharacterized protein n=1 Tax=Thermomonospora echinospora TaxID=1992 RepID=A0A1H5X8U5_9ACTN|nr:hypothetical protein [Thermomonospora echinospora]SEG08178.1 hypothetical protein SAMN04489712_103144 [Thermomonospora echinospora]
MIERAEREEDLGHEPEVTHDRDFAPVNRGADARGGTVTPQEEGMARQEDEPGTGTPGVDVGHPDAIPPDAEGVAEAERQDSSRYYKGR